MPASLTIAGQPVPAWWCFAVEAVERMTPSESVAAAKIIEALVEHLVAVQSDDVTDFLELRAKVLTGTVSPLEAANDIDGRLTDG